MSTPRPHRSNRRPTPRDLAPREPLPPRHAAIEPVEDLEDEYDDDTYDSDEPADPAQAQEIEARGHYVTASLCGESVRVVPPGAWRQSWQRHLHAGRVDAFADKVIHPADLQAYYDIDPTNDEFGQFVADAAELAGEPMGKSHGPSRSTRRTRRR